MNFIFLKNEKLSRRERVKNFFLLAIGWKLISMVSGLFISAWKGLAGKNREPIKNDTFAAACRRHEVTPEGLQQIMKHLLLNKRCYWLLFWVAVYFWALGLILIFSTGVNMARVNMTIASLGSMGVFAALSLKYTFRHWQCEIKRLASLDEFWAAGGGKKLLKW